MRRKRILCFKRKKRSLTRALSRLFLCSWKAAGLFRAVYRKRDGLTFWCSVKGNDVHIGHWDCQVLDRLIRRVFEVGSGRLSKNTRTFPVWAKLLQTAGQYILCLLSNTALTFKYSSTHVSVNHLCQQWIVFDIEELYKKNVKLVIKCHNERSYVQKREHPLILAWLKSPAERTKGVQYNDSKCVYPSALRMSKSIYFKRYKII